MANRLSSRIRHLLISSALGLSVIAPSSALADDVPSFDIAWTIYVGWMPFGYMQDEGIIDRWADRYDIEINLIQVNDYIGGINLYTAGRYDGATMTNMDALTIPAAGGKDSTSLIITDYSNGNDAVVLKDGESMSDIAGRDVHLVQYSVSHYTLARALEMADMTERDINTVNTSDADIVAVFTQPEVSAVTAWNPQLGEIAAQPGASVVFDSSDIPGEILDMLVVDTETLNEHPELGKALTGAWYETMALMYGDDPEARDAARSAMAEAAGTDLPGYNTQLDATFMFDTPEKKLAFATDEELVSAMDFVREFSARHALLGDNVTDPGFIGMSFPEGATLGDENNIQLRFNTDFIRMAADGEL